MKKITKCRTLLVAGIILGLGPLWGLLGSMLAMVTAFGRMGEAGMGQPEALAGDIGAALYSTAAGIIMCPIGAVLIILSVICKDRMNKEPPPVPLDSSVDVHAEDG